MSEPPRATRPLLIAEEEGRISAFMEKGLRQSGYATVVASRGPDALRLASSGEYGLLILDLGLPGMDGLEILEELRRRDVRLPVLVVTARPGVEAMLADLPGPTGYLAKPFPFEELLDRVRGLLAAAERDAPYEACTSQPRAISASTACVTNRVASTGLLKA